MPLGRRERAVDVDCVTDRLIPASAERPGPCVKKARSNSVNTHFVKCAPVYPGFIVTGCRGHTVRREGGCMAVVSWGSRTRRPGAWAWQKRAGVILGLCWPLLGQAAAYLFPGNLPSGCSGSAGTYTCGAVTLAAGDPLNVGSASINAAGSASNLTLNVSGMLSASAGAIVKANVNAGSVSSTGAVSYGGSLSTTTGAVSLGAGTTVTGALTTTTGAITLLTGTAVTYTTVGSISAGGTVTLNSYNSVNGDLVGYLVSAAGHNKVAN